MTAGTDARAGLNCSEKERMQLRPDERKAVAGVDPFPGVVRVQEFRVEPPPAS